MKSFKKLKIMKTNKNWSLLWNPFIRIAGWQAFGMGIVIVIISAVLASFGNLLFNGAIDAHFVSNVSIWSSFIVTGISLLSVVLTMYIVALIISKDFRFVDILGTMTFARIPFIILALVSLFITFPDVEQIIQDPMIILNVPSFWVFILISVPVIVWYIALMYNGLKVSTGVNGSKLIIGFILGLLVAEIISKLLICFII